MAPPHYSHPSRNAIRFFKIIVEHSLQEGKLKVPDSFIQKYGDGMPNPVHLKPPDGTEWEINWTKYENGEVWFAKGWDEVVRYYSLGHGHLVLFKYERTGTSHFKVNIFHKGALEIDYPLHKNLPQMNDDSCSVEILHEKPPLSSSSCRPGKKIRSEEAERTSNQQKKHSHGNKVKSTKAEPNLVKFESEEMVTGSIFPTKETPKSRAIKKAKEKPLTCEEKDRALQRVNTFKAKNPYFKIALQPAYIRSYLCAPANFVKENLKQNNEGNVLLTVSDGRTWRVKCNREVGKMHKFRFLSGWSSFVEDNNLKVGDVCVFELTNPIDISFLVHVFGDCANRYG